jgi:tRNA-dihydrouridine synthase 3
VQVVAALQAAGASAVLIHGRTQEQRYNKAANWDLISQVASAASIPIIGNGDVLTLFEVHLNKCHVTPATCTVPGAWFTLRCTPMLMHRRRCCAQADRRLQQKECLAVLAGRGALTRPWLFEEWRTQQELFPTAAERVGIYRCSQFLAACDGLDQLLHTKSWA